MIYAFCRSSKLIMLTLIFFMSLNKQNLAIYIDVVKAIFEILDTLILVKESHKKSLDHFKLLMLISM
ncbi:hypothetical protein BTN92_08455 [Enterococcus mundtii]|uniref:Uncharacterized protein n=1 Tax=Enterococcus mundtii TaxID=53346 RepID=A0A1V2UIF6_ENTMU|nr:hypothetical protein BTN92_08455 [Enterococcus mundtii]